VVAASCKSVVFNDELLKSSIFNFVFIAFCNYIFSSLKSLLLILSFVSESNEFYISLKVSTIVLVDPSERRTYSATVDTGYFSEGDPF